MRLENKRMKAFLAEHGIPVNSVQYLHTGSLKGCWRVYAAGQKWTEDLVQKFTNLQFTDFNGAPLSIYSGNGGAFSVCICGHYEMLER